LCDLLHISANRAAVEHEANDATAFNDGADGVSGARVRSMIELGVSDRIIKRAMLVPLGSQQPAGNRDRIIRGLFASAYTRPSYLTCTSLPAAAY
jgi:hypothetical protein